MDCSMAVILFIGDRFGGPGGRNRKVLIVSHRGYSIFGKLLSLKMDFTQPFDICWILLDTRSLFENRFASFFLRKSF